MAALCLALVLLSSAAAAATARTEVSIDLGWRFNRGPPPTGTCGSPFNQNFTGQQCNGLAAVPSATSPADCSAACCGDPLCEIWQYLDAPLPGGGCWIGQVPSSGCNGGTQWISFANTSRADGTVPQWATLGFADGNWSVVDAPHDFIIVGANETASPYVNDRSLQGQAFIPKTVATYRKHFQLPASWQGTHVELYNEGMYAYAEYYLNGQSLGTHALGYTSFFARLDNVSGGLFFDGRDNVLAVYVDATSSRDTGWWQVTAQSSATAYPSSFPPPNLPSQPSCNPSGTRAAEP
jgi:hypothetical protein